MRKIIKIGIYNKCEVEFNVSDYRFDHEFGFHIEFVYGINSFRQNFHSDKDIMNFFNIDPHIYYDILNRNNGIYNKGMNRYYFKTIKDIENIIKEIESHLILNKLVE